MGGVVGGMVDGKMPEIDADLAKKTAAATLDFIGIPSYITGSALGLDDLSKGDSGGPKPCWTETKARGKPRFIDDCPRTMEKEGLFCYPKCKKAGYTGWGDSCYKDCPRGWTDHGIACTKPDGYLRGVPSWSKSACLDAWKNEGAPHADGFPAPSKVTCQKDDNLLGNWYPKANPGFDCTGPHCRAVCPKGTTDLLLVCNKTDSLARGASSGLTCAPGYEYDSMGFCYESCGEGWFGVGPVCWRKCPAQHKPCGGALCLPESESCAANIFNKVKHITKTVIKGAAADPTVAFDAIDVVKDYALPICTF